MLSQPCYDDVRVRDLLPVQLDVRYLPLWPELECVDVFVGDASELQPSLNLQTESVCCGSITGKFTVILCATIFCNRILFIKLVYLNGDMDRTSGDTGNWTR